AFSRLEYLRKVHSLQIGRVNIIQQRIDQVSLQAVGIIIPDVVWAAVGPVRRKWSAKAGRKIIIPVHFHSQTIKLGIAVEGTAGVKRRSGVRRPGGTIERPQQRAGDLAGEVANANHGRVFTTTPKP